MYHQAAHNIRKQVHDGVFPVLSEHYQPPTSINDIPNNMEQTLPPFLASSNRFLEAAPVNVDDAPLGEVAVMLEMVFVAEVAPVGTMTDLTALDVVTEVIDVVSRGTVLVPSKMTLAEMTGLEAKVIVELPLVMVHCVVTAGLL